MGFRLGVDADEAVGDGFESAPMLSIIVTSSMSSSSASSSSSSEPFWRSSITFSRLTCSPAALGVLMPIGTPEELSLSRLRITEGAGGSQSLLMICLSQPGPRSSRHFIFRELGDLLTRCLRPHIAFKRSRTFIECACSQSISNTPASIKGYR